VNARSMADSLPDTSRHVHFREGSR
jgi:hypothetical protein